MIPTSGPIKMSVVNVELSRTASATLSLGNSLVRSLAKVPATGTISMSQLRGRSRRVLVTKTFTSSSTWTAPASTTSIISLTGKGGEGESADTYTQEYYVKRITRHRHKRDGSLPERVWDYYDETPIYGTKPADTSVHTPTPSDPVYFGYTDYELYYTRYETVTEPAEYGGDSKAFGKTFPGTYGSNPVAANYYNLPVVPGTTYTIIVAGGGPVTFTYEEDDLAGTNISQTVTSNTTVTIPANTVVTLVGSGGTGSTTTVSTPGQPYIAPTIAPNPHAVRTQSDYYTYYFSASSNTTTHATCNDTPGNTGKTNVTTQTYVQGGETLYWYKWDCPTVTNPGQPYIPPGTTTQNNTGPSTTATLNGVTRTWAGGSGGAAASSTQTLTSGSVAQTLTIVVGSGGQVTYSYNIP